MKRTGLSGYDYKFGVNYYHFNVTNFDKVIPFIHDYFMAKYGIK